MAAQQPFVFLSASGRQRWAQYGRLLLLALGVGVLVLQLWHNTLSPWMVLWLGIIAIDYGISTFWPRRPQEPAISISGDGLGGTTVTSAIGTDIPWAAVKRIWRDQDAVVVVFDPLDLNSNDPRQRISKIRLATNGSIGADGLLAQMARHTSLAGIDKN